MNRVTFVRGAKQLLTLRGPVGPRRRADLENLGIVQDGAVLIVDGLIHDVGSSRRLENLALARNAEEIDATGKLVMPGFVDGHARLITGPERGRGGVGGGLLALARAIQDLSQRALEAQAVHAVEEAVRHGTTTLEAESGLGLSEASEVKMLRVHSSLRRLPIEVVSSLLISGIPAGFEGNSDQYIDWVATRMLPLIKRRKLAEFVSIHCGRNAFTLEQARRCLSTARQMGFVVKIQAGRGAPSGVIPLAIEMGAASIGDVADLTVDEAALLGRSETIATLLPGEAFFLDAPHYAPARMLIDSGVAVALATGYDADTRPSQNLQMTIALACAKMQMTPAEAISAATMNAAYSLRRSASVGSLERGKSADLLILDVPDYREIPYHFGVNLVDFVMKKGMPLVQRTEVKWPVH